MAKRKRKQPAASETEPAVVDCHSLRFSRERIEKMRNGRRVTSFARSGVRQIRILNDSPSEGPIREAYWAVLFGGGGIFVVLRASETSSKLAGAALCAVAGVLVWHQLRKTTIVEIESRDGVIRVAADGKLTDNEIAKLKRRVEDELDWPVRW